MSGKPTKRVRASHLAAWCAPGLPVAALGLPLVVYLPPHYAGTLGLPLATVGLIFALVRICDIPLDPLLGALMDNTRSRWGQFRPWIVGGSLALMAGAYLAFHAPPGVSALRTFIGLFILYIGFSCMSLAQVSWGSRLSGDYGERARIFGVWTAFNVLGTLSVLLIPPVVARLDPTLSASSGIHWMGWFILAIAPLTALWAAAIVPEGEAPSETHRVRWADVRLVLADPRMGRLLAVDLIFSVAGGLTGALFLFFFTAARNLPLATASALLLGYFVAGLLAAPLWIRLARTQGKHRAATLAALWGGFALLAVLFSPRDSLWAGAIAMIVAGVPFAAPPFLLRAMLADLNDAQSLDRLDKGVTGADTTGLNFAILIATAKLGYAIPVGLTYPILALIGFNPAPGAANTPEALFGLELLFSLPAFALSLLAAVLIWRWPIDAAEHGRIRARLEA